jgi:hypothetical protein
MAKTKAKAKAKAKKETPQERLLHAPTTVDTFHL